jgi:mannose-6-phosphate isomerase-like protein (cupin superfamily)
VHVRSGTRHGVHNPADVPVRLIEVQCGGDLDEDDTGHSDDITGRG